MSQFEEETAAFLAWLVKSGAEISNKIELRDLRQSQAGRGVVAIQDIQEDELLFRVPRSSILSVDNSVLPKRLPSVFKDLDPWFSLILVMMYEWEQDGKSKWHPYFQVLPFEFNTLMFWEQDELEQLQASAVRNKIGKEQADYTFKDTILPIVMEHAEVFYPSYGKDAHDITSAFVMESIRLAHRMGSTIMAYAFDIEPVDSNSKAVDEEGYMSEVEDEALPKGMVPLADMLNADADKNNARLFYEEDSLSMKALKHIKAGEEIFNDYGPLPRSDLLRRYGYITNNYAKYDVVEIPFDTVHETVLKNSAPASGIETRLEYLDEQGIVDTGYDIITSDPFDIHENISSDLIILIEALLLPQSAFDRLKSKSKLPKPSNLSLKGAQLLHTMVKARIAQYATSLEADTSESTTIPLTGSYSSRERRYAMAKLVRIGEKVILRDAEKALADLIEELGAGNDGLKRPPNSPQGSPGKKTKFA
ncbi:SET domain-containing protein [Zopfia rhizophila CBS 207.26]|uniref:SET domain-containing protein n=1 Tax=Zopfia rhizophila CBS 207.26 TaxID=1314779 RepID=A0A6A6DU08_9PEZI|nr:SET domain-containing protein [Zopfia rhizophila CBS 207.26]